MSDWSEMLKPTDINTEAGHIKRYVTSLSGPQLIIVLGIAISGLAAFINTYNAITKINAQIQQCTDSPQLRSALNKQFIVILVLSCFAVVLGIFLAWLFRKATNQRQLLTLGIIAIGIFGILYAISIKFQYVANDLKLGLSWVSLAAFIILGFFLSSKQITIKTPDVSWT